MRCPLLTARGLGFHNLVGGLFHTGQEQLQSARFQGWTNGFVVGSIFVAPLLIATACALSRRHT